MNFTVAPDQYGRYVADSKTPMLVDSVIDEFGDELDSSEYVVIYLNDGDGDGLTDGDTIATNTINGVNGAYPKESANYVAVVYPADEWARMKEEHADWFDANGNPIDRWAWNESAGTGSYSYKAQPFRIAADASETKSLEGAFAFEVDPDEGSAATNSAREDFSDTAFKYLGKTIDVAFAVDGTGLDRDDDYVVSWNCSRSDVNVSADITYANSHFTLPAKAATYTATLYGQGEYAGSEETVTITVDPIDLSKDVVAVKTADDGAGYQLPTYTAGGDKFAENYAFVTVNGEPVSQGAALDMVATKFEGFDGVVKAMPHSISGQTSDSSYVAPNSKGVYTFKFAPTYEATGNPDVVGSPVEAEGLVVADVVNFYYNGVEVSTGLNGTDFVVGSKTGFDPDGLAAYTSYTSAETNTPAKFTYKVTKDGKEVTSYDEPGTYVVTLDSAVTAGFASAGHEVVTFTVSDPVVSIEDAFFQVDGKSIDGTFYYTGKAYDVDVVAYDAKKNMLTEGEDYTVVYKLDDEAVESMVDAGTYDVEVYAKGNDKTPAKTAQFTISAAPVKSAKADQAIYAYTGDVIEPTFTGYTEDDLTGLSVALNADNAKVTYKKADTTGDFTITVAADELKAVGTYQATIDLPQDFKNFADATPMATAEFKVAEQVAFSDVAADAWYAEAVYTAAQDGSAATSTVTDFRYMTGIEGTKLFMPEALITRAEVAQVFFNMAGGEKDTDGTEYPTKFADVDQAAWYAQAISWASTAGVVGGYDGTDSFGTFDNATREQVATMIYRYAKAQGLDVTVSDEAAALAKYADGASVSDWAKAAMAWCVEQGIFGVDVDTLRPQDNLTRAEMAATAVRVQPDGRKQAL